MKKYKATTPSLRSLINIDRSNIWKGRPIKTKVRGKISSGGRNNTGRITAYHKGGGHKKLYREIDFKRNTYDQNAEVVRIEYDPNRTAFIALIKYDISKTLSYIICPSGLNKGDKVTSSLSAIEPKTGNYMKLEYIPVGTPIHNIELKVGKGGQIARSAGSWAKVIGKSDDYAKLVMKSSKTRLIPLECRAAIGTVSNEDHQHVVIAKAGRSRWLGKRPIVRGVAMNPVDHPHGGGEGKTSGGRIPVTPWGKKTKGKKTRNNKRTDKFIIKTKKQ